MPIMNLQALLMSVIRIPIIGRYRLGLQFDPTLICFILYRFQRLFGTKKRLVVDASPAYVAQSTSPSELTLFPNTPPLSLNAGGLCGDHEVSFEPLPKIYSRPQGQNKRPRDVERVKLDQAQILKPAYFEQRLDRNSKRCDWFGE